VYSCWWPRLPRSRQGLSRRLAGAGPAWTVAAGCGSRWDCSCS
jgi:hypothetical protein